MLQNFNVNSFTKVKKINQISEFIFRIIIPTLIVIMENSVETTIISPANFELPPMASAIIKDAIAVGLANSINNITISFESK